MPFYTLSNLLDLFSSCLQRNKHVVNFIVFVFRVGKNKKRRERKKYGSRWSITNIRNQLQSSMTPLWPLYLSLPHFCWNSNKRHVVQKFWFHFRFGLNSFGSWRKNERLSSNRIERKPSRWTNQNQKIFIIIFDDYF